MGDLVSVIQFAKIKGVSEAAVRKALSNSRISALKVGGRLKIDPDKALKEWDENRDASLTRSPAGIIEMPQEKPKDENGKEYPSFAESRAVREAFQARVTQLEYEKKKGELVNRSEVEEDLLVLARALRDALLNIPSKIATEVAVETEPYKVEKMLERELRQALEELARSKYIGKERARA